MHMARPTWAEWDINSLRAPEKAAGFYPAAFFMPAGDCEMFNVIREEEGMIEY